MIYEAEINGINQDEQIQDALQTFFRRILIKKNPQIGTFKALKQV